MNPQEALEHLKTVVETATKEAQAQSVIPKYTSKLLVCFSWENDDVHGSLDCDQISTVFEEVYGAHVVRLVLEMKEYKPWDVMTLVLPIHPLLAKQSQLVILFYRYIRLI